MSTDSDLLKEIVINTADQIQLELINTGNISSQILTVLSFFLEVPEIINKIETELQLPITGDINKLIENYRSKYYTHSHCFEHFTPNECLIEAAKYGHVDVAVKAIEKGATNHIWSMIYAAKNGYIDIVKIMLEEAVKDYKILLEYIGNDTDIIEIYLRNRYDDYNNSIKLAAENGHDDIVQLIQSWKLNHEYLFP